MISGLESWWHHQAILAAGGSQEGGSRGRAAFLDRLEGEQTRLCLRRPSLSVGLWVWLLLLTDLRSAQKGKQRDGDLLEVSGGVASG